MTFTEAAFDTEVPPLLMAAGVVVAVIVGALGGALPAIRAGRTPVVKLIRAW